LRRLIISLLSTLCLATAVAAHVPHDVMNVVAVSPDFGQDGTVFGAFVFIDQRHFGRSTDGGRNWELRMLPMAQHGIAGFAFSPAYASDATAFCATDGGVYRSTDRGLTWQAINTGLTQLSTSSLAISPQFAGDDTLVLATRTGAFRSVDRGDSWQASEPGLTEAKLDFATFALGAGNTPVVFIGGKRVHRSTDLGLTWTELHDFGTAVAALAASPSFASDDTLVVALSSAAVHASVNAGTSFSLSSAGLTDLVTTDVVFTATGELFLCSDVGVWQAAGPFQPWTPRVVGLQALDPLGSPHFRALAPSPDYAADNTLVLASFEGCYRTLDGAATWSPVNSLHQQLVNRLVLSPEFELDRFVLAASPGAGTLAWRVPSTPGTRARIQGANLVGSGLAGAAPATQPMPPSRNTGFGQAAGIELQAGATDLSSLWNSGLAISPDFSADGTLFFGYLGAFRSTNRGAGWTNLPLPPGLTIVRDLAVSPGFSSDDTVFVGTNGVGFYRSTDRGDTWVAADAGLPFDFKTRRIRVSPEHLSDQTLYAASWNHGIWKSTTGGAAWQFTSADIPGINLQSLAISPDHGNDGMLLAGEKPGRLWRTTDRGNSWATADNGLPGADALLVTDIAFSPDFAVDRMIAVATGDGSVWISTDAASSWQLVTTYIDGTVRALAFSPNFAQDGLLIAAAPPQLRALRPLKSPGNGLTATRSPVLIRGDDAAFAVQTSAGWDAVATANSFGSTTTRSGFAGAWREWEFYGSSITCYGERGPDAPLVDISIDAAGATTVDLYAPVLEQQVPFFVQSFSSSDWHTVRVTHTGLSHPQSTGSVLGTDGFATTR
jgi:photosystem II stability/assembly factor-like uncharacterized protein